MVVVEARSPDGKLIEVAEVSISQDSQRIMITDDQGHQVFVHRGTWQGIVRAVSDLLHAQNVGLARSVLEVRQRAQSEIETSWESRWPGILDNALDDIVDLCNTYMKQEEH